MNIQPLVDAVKELQSGFNLNIVVYENVVWSFDNNILAINKDKNEDDLYNLDGDTYTWELYHSEGVVTGDGYVIFYDADNGCGTRDTVIVSANERAMWE